MQASRRTLTKSLWEHLARLGRCNQKPANRTALTKKHLLKTLRGRTRSISCWKHNPNRKTKQSSSQPKHILKSTKLRSRLLERLPWLQLLAQQNLSPKLRSSHAAVLSAAPILTLSEGFGVSLEQDRPLFIHIFRLCQFVGSKGSLPRQALRAATTVASLPEHAGICDLAYAHTTVRKDLKSVMKGIWVYPAAISIHQSMQRDCVFP